MNKPLAILIGLGGLGVILALGKKSEGAVTGPPLPLVWMPTEYAEPSNRQSLDFIVLGVEGDVSGITHYQIGTDAIVQLVDEKDIAKGSGVAEIDERALYLVVQDTSQTVLDAAAWVVARAVKHWSVPLAFVDAPKIDKQARGITTHNELARSILNPGQLEVTSYEFPMDELLALAKHHR